MHAAYSYHDSIDADALTISFGLVLIRIDEHFMIVTSDTGSARREAATIDPAVHMDYKGLNLRVSEKWRSQ